MESGLLHDSRVEVVTMKDLPEAVAEISPIQARRNMRVSNPIIFLKSLITDRMNAMFLINKRVGVDVILRRTWEIPRVEWMKID